MDNIFVSEFNGKKITGKVENKIVNIAKNSGYKFNGPSGICFD